MRPAYLDSRRGSFGLGGSRAGGVRGALLPMLVLEDMAMRNFDFSPLYRSTVGFNRVFDMLDSASRGDTLNNWPPYNIEKTGEDQYRITMAVAGFGPEEINITAQGNSLLVTGQKKPEPEGAQ